MRSIRRTAARAIFAQARAIPFTKALPLNLTRTLKTEKTEKSNFTSTDDFGDEASFSRFSQNVMAKRLEDDRREWSPENQLTVFFDGGCPLCKREMNHYMRLHSKYCKLVPTVDFYDISSRPLHPELERRGITKEDTMKRIHALSESGVVVKNFEAFQQLWLRLPYWHVIGKLGHLPFIPPIANMVYSIWADRRFEMRVHLPDTAACSIKNR